MRKRTIQTQNIKQTVKRLQVKKQFAFVQKFKFLCGI